MTHQKWLSDKILKELLAKFPNLLCQLALFTLKDVHLRWLCSMNSLLRFPLREQLKFKDILALAFSSLLSLTSWLKLNSNLLCFWKIKITPSLFQSWLEVAASTYPSMSRKTFITWMFSFTNNFTVRRLSCTIEAPTQWKFNCSSPRILSLI